MLIKPKALRPGATIGIVSPSSTIAPFPRRLERGIDALRKLKFEVCLSEHAGNSNGHTSGTAQERAADINNFFKDASIDAIVCSTGGWNANSVLPLLDYEMISRNPKIFCGYSDITALNVAIFHQSNLVTFNGPTVLPTFGEFPAPLSYSVNQFIKAISSNEPLGILSPPANFTEENLYWDREDDRSRSLKIATPWKSIIGGMAEGTSLVANLSTLSILGGTTFFPDFTDRILFLEDEGKSTSFSDRHLAYLEQLGVFNKINGLVYARPCRYETHSSDRTLFDILKDLGAKYKMPILADVDFGHTDPIPTLPLGIPVRLNSNSGEIVFLESATT